MSVVLGSDDHLKPPAGSDRERDNKFYELLAGGAKMRLLEAFLQLKLPELLGKRRGVPMKASDICSELGLDITRGWKFLHCLALSGLLFEFRGERAEDSTEDCLSIDSENFFGASGDPNESYYFRDLVLYWRYLNELPVSLVSVLKGAPLPVMPVWPPATFQAAQHLELWMTVTAKGACDTVLQSKAMHGANCLLDVGGGDGTIAIAVVCASAMETGEATTTATVFNLPASAALARDKILQQNISEYIDVLEGNFLTDELPRGPSGDGYDRVLFSRVLTDWTPNVCKTLFEKARRALSPGGRLVINEAFAEGNRNYFVSWEYRYMFYDTFGRLLFKPLEVYRQLLEECGFRILSVSPMLDDAFYSVVVAEVV
jgi:ubiquinone/menaquinone biosynthesis C-methylase UbiE